MIKALFGGTTAPQLLRQGLDASMETHRVIAKRIAEASQASNEATANAEGEAPAASLADDMASLADTQLRFEAEARLLQLTYQGLRRSIHSNG